MLRFLQREDWFESRLFSALGWTLLCLYMSAQILACLGTPIGEYDDAIPLVSSKLVQLGRTPSVDFKSFYPPLYYYLLAAGFHFYGQTVLVARFLAVILYVLLVAMAALFYRTEFPHLRSLIPFLTFPVAVAMWTFNYPSWPGYALALLSVLVYVTSRHSARLNMQSIALSGLLAGLSTLMRFNFGPYALVAVMTDIFLTEILTKANSPLRTRQNRALVQAAAFCIPFIFANLIFYLAIYGAGAIAVPLQTARFSMGAMNSGAFLRLRPELSALACLAAPCGWISVRKIVHLDKISTVALIPAVFSAILIALAIFTPPTPTIALWFPALSFFFVIAIHLFVIPLPRAALCFLLLYTCVQHYYLTRADGGHVMLFYPIIALTFPFIFASPAGLTNNEEQPDVTMYKGQIFLVLVAITGAMFTKWELPKIGFAKNGARMILNGGLDPQRSDRERMLVTGREEYYELDDEIQAIEFVRQRTAPSTLIFVGVRNHAGSFVNHVRAYWLSERLPGVSYVHLDSGIASKEPVQREIIEELQRNAVDWAILYDTTGGWFEDAFENHRGGSGVLDEYLQENFEEEARFGRYSVCSRKHL